MRVKLLYLIVSLSFALSMAAQEKYEITGVSQGLSFSDLVSKIEASYPVKFYYREEWVKDLKTGDYPGCTSLQCLLSNLLKGTRLHYLIEESGNILITESYSVRIPSVQSKDESTFLPPADYSDSSSDLQYSGNAFIDVGNPADKNKAGNVVLSGYIKEKDTREPIAGVTLYVRKIAVGTISNEFGYFSLTLPRGTHLLQCSFVGMRERMININLYGPGELNIDMNSMLIPLKEAVVSARKNLTLQRFEVGAERINISSFKLLPTSMGESDIIKGVLLVPGVQSVGEGSAGFNVRGGSADQNLILLYGAPVYNASHFFGFFSSVNSDIIKDVTLYKGGIPGKYGGRISSVLDIGTLEGNRTRFAGNAGISPVTAHFMVEGPLVRDTLTYLLSARTTYSNWLLKLIENPSIQNSRASFYDINGKLTWDINRKNKVDLSSYYSHDSFRFNNDTLYSYDNSIIAVRWRHFFSNNFFSSMSLNNSYYRYNISSESDALEAYSLSHSINSTAFKADMNLFRGRHELNFGLDLTRYVVLPGSYLPQGDSSLVIPRELEKERAIEGALYFEDKVTLNSFLSVNAGLRFSGFGSFGPDNVLIYNPEFTKSESNVTDTIFFGRNTASSRYGGPELRLSVNIRLNDLSSFKINYNRTRQYIHMLSNSASISPTDIWKLSDYHLKPQSGTQYAAGYYRMLFGGKLEASAEVYYKTLKNMIDFKGGSNYIMVSDIEQDVVNVEGKSYGIEMVLRKTEGKARFTLGYTYSRTFIRSVSTLPEETINSGECFPSNFDNPNDLIVTFDYIFTRRFSFSSNYTWSTGHPITYPLAAYYMSDNMLLHYSDRNKYRIPDYSRLDVSFRISGNLKSNKAFHPNWTFSVYNLLGRQNVYSVYFRKDGDFFKGYKLSVFGQAIPSVTLSFDF